jgi:hypothetical protein
LDGRIRQGDLFENLAQLGTRLFDRSAMELRD